MHHFRMRLQRQNFINVLVYLHLFYGSLHWYIKDIIVILKNTSSIHTIFLRNENTNVIINVNFGYLIVKLLL